MAHTTRRDYYAHTEIFDLLSSLFCPSFAAVSFLPRVFSLESVFFFIILFEGRIRSYYTKALIIHFNFLSISFWLLQLPPEVAALFLEAEVSYFFR